VLSELEIPEIGFPDRLQERDLETQGQGVAAVLERERPVVEEPRFHVEGVRLPVVLVDHPLLEFFCRLLVHLLAPLLAVDALQAREDEARRLPGHHRRPGPHGGEDKQRVEGPAAHAEIRGAVVRTDDPLDPRDLRAGHGPDHAGAVLADTGVLLGRPYHVAGGVLDVEKGDLHRGAADDPFDGLAGRVHEDDAVVVAGDDSDGDPLEVDLPADDVVAPPDVVLALVLAEVAVVGDAGEHLADVDAPGGLLRKNRVQVIGRDFRIDRLAALAAQGLLRVEGQELPELFDPVVLGSHEVIGPAGDVGVDPGSPEVLHAHRLPDGGFHHGRPAQEGIGHLVDHDGLAGQVDDVGPPGRVAARAERVLLEPLG